MEKIEWILFDLDGTLIDTKIYLALYDRIISIILKETNQTIEQLNVQAIFLQVSKNVNGQFDTGELCDSFGLRSRYYEILEEEIKSKNYLCSQTKEVFQKIKDANGQSQIKIGIVSNSYERTIKLYTKHYGLEKYLSLICGSDTVNAPKSDKKFWEYIIDEKQVVPYNAIMVGDNIIEDNIIPKQYGFKTVYIRRSSDLKNVLRLLNN